MAVILPQDARRTTVSQPCKDCIKALRIADLSAMTVGTEVSEADVRRVQPDMPVYFTTLGGDARRWRGKVRQVLPAPAVAGGVAAGTVLAPSTSTVILYTVLFEVDNAEGELMPQMTAQVVLWINRFRTGMTLLASSSAWRR